MRVAAYIRVSTEEQKINGLSIDAQKNALTDYAQKHQMEIVDYYIDAGLTARKKLTHRKELQRLLEDIKKGSLDLIIFTKLDRWFRNIADYYRVQEILDEYKINWKTIFENYDTSTANGRLHINIMLSIAQDEADRTSERIKVVFENKRAKGETPSSKAPLGYKIVNSKLLINEETKQIAIDIFDYYDTFHTISGCVRMAWEKYNYKIYDYSIRRMLNNTIYIGEFRGYKNFCDSLIPSDLFHRIKNYREVRVFKNQLINGRVYLFSTLIFCNECKHRMSSCFTMQQQKHGPKEFHYYRCKSATVNYQCSHKTRVNEDNIEEYLMLCLREKMYKKFFSIESTTRPNRIRKTGTVKLKKRLEKLKDLYLEDLIDKDTYKLEYDSVYVQLNNASLQPPDCSENCRLSQLHDLDSLYHSMSLQERKAFWLGIIDHIVIDKDNNIDFYLKE